MISTEQFLEEVIRPSLRFLDPDVPYDETEDIDIEQLMLGTALQESKLTYLRQLGGGPALGLFQMEPQTHDDIWANWLAYRARIRIKMQRAFGRCEADDMITDMMYACCMARLHYRRVPDPLPPAYDIGAQASYWKEFYNTPVGHGTPAAYTGSWLAAGATALWSAGRVS